MELTVSTSEATEVIDVTDSVAGAVPDDATDGTVTVFVPHTTAGVAVNEAEPRLIADLEAALERLVPDRDYRHDKLDDNAAAHLRATVIGESVTVPISSGQLALGRWQSVLFVECDGPRDRRLHVVTNGS